MLYLTHKFSKYCMKSKPCTKKCQSKCLVNRANHIPHEHFIMALSFLIIALSGIITTVNQAEAKTTVKKRVVYTSSCVDPDKRNIATKGTTALIKYDKQNRKDSSLVKSNTDSCINTTTVREYICNVRKITSFNYRCPDDFGCYNGACLAKKLIPTNTSTPTILNTPSSTPSSTSHSASSTSTKPPANNNVIIGGDGTWCNLHSSPNSIYFAPTSCEDNVGKKVASTCSGDNLSTYSCGYTYDGANYKDVRCQQYVQPCSWLGSQCTANHCKLPENQTSTPSSTFSCNDSDNGKYEDIKGTISITNSQGEIVSSESESCASDDSTKELFCTNTSWPRFSSTTIACESGICSDGACVTFTSP